MQHALRVVHYASPRGWRIRLSVFGGSPIKNRRFCGHIVGKCDSPAKTLLAALSCFEARDDEITDYGLVFHKSAKVANSTVLALNLRRIHTAMRLPAVLTLNGMRYNGIPSR